MKKKLAQMIKKANRFLSAASVSLHWTGGSSVNEKMNQLMLELTNTRF